MNELGLSPALLDAKAKLNAFYNGIASLSSIGNAFKGVGDTAGLVQDALSMIDLPLQARLMMFRLKRHDGTASNVPDLLMRVNPDTFTVSYKKKSDLVYTTGGFVTQHWHDDKITIRAGGWVPSFRGRAKILTEGYTLFLELLNIYKKCGHMESFLGQQLVSRDLDSAGFLKKYTDSKPQDKSQKDGGTAASEVPTSTGSEGKQVQVVQSLFIYPRIELIYQNDIYEGIFTEFTSKEDYEMPNTLRYDFTFLADTRRDTVTDGLGATLSSFGTAQRVLKPFTSFSGPRIG